MNVRRFLYFAKAGNDVLEPSEFRKRYGWATAGVNFYYGLNEGGAEHLEKTGSALRPNHRLFFEMVGQALQGRPGTEGLLANLVEPWVEPVIDAAERVGLPPEAAAADVRLYLATARGLLLDLLATGDRAAVDAAMRRFSDLLLADPSPAPP